MNVPEIDVCLYFPMANDCILEKLICVETLAEDIKNMTLPTQINRRTVPDC